MNLAVGMKIAYPEKSIGLLDADVFGPSVPLMMNLNETPLLSKDNLMIPLMNYGVKWYYTTYRHIIAINSLYQRLLSVKINYITVCPWVFS